MKILCFLTSDLILTDRQARFQTILCLEKDTQLLSGGYFAFSGHPTKETQIVTIDTEHFPQSETTTTTKITKKSTHTKEKKILILWTF